MGGLVVRHYLSGHLMEGLGRVVLMGTPNRGSSHGNLALRISPRLRRVFRALPDLAEPGLTIAPPLNVPPPQVGIVIGFKPDPIRGRLLRGENDGLVTAESVRGVEAADELRVACPHEWIHWRWDVAEAVDTFLKTGKFKPTKSAD
jgi:hypothetical protein